MNRVKVYYSSLARMFHSCHSLAIYQSIVFQLKDYFNSSHCFWCSFSLSRYLRSCSIATAALTLATVYSRDLGFTTKATNTLHHEKVSLTQSALLFESSRMDQSAKIARAGPQREGPKKSRSVSHGERYLRESHRKLQPHRCPRYCGLKPTTQRSQEEKSALLWQRISLRGAVWA